MVQKKYIQEKFAGSNKGIALQLDKKGIRYKLRGNANVDIDDPDAIAEAVKSLTDAMTTRDERTPVPMHLPSMLRICRQRRNALRTDNG